MQHPPWRALPVLETVRTTMNDMTGKRTKRTIISPGAFTGLQKAGIALINVLPVDPPDDTPKLSAARVKKLLKKPYWPEERPSSSMSYRRALRLLNTFMRHLNAYRILLMESNEKAAQSEDPRVQEHLEDMETRYEGIEAILSDWDNIDKCSPCAFLCDEFVSKLELEF